MGRDDRERGCLPDALRGWARRESSRGQTVIDESTPRRDATITDVARASRVSPATVSRVLNGNPRVAPELVKRVEAAALEINYRPNFAGRALRRQKSDLFAAIIPDVRNPFFVRLMEAFEKVANAEGFSVVLCNSHEGAASEKAAIETVIAHRVSGVLIAAAVPRAAQMRPFERAGIPVITVDRQIDGFAGDSVSVDNHMIGRLAAEHLVAQGRTRPLVLNHTIDLSPMRDRELGFRTSMAMLGHPVPEERVHRLLFDDGRPHAVARLLYESAEGCDSVFATTNTLTGEAFFALRDQGRLIGPEVGLVGVDDDRWNLMVEPQVTVVDQPSAQLGAWAGQLLATRARGTDMENARIILDPVLRARASSVRT